MIIVELMSGTAADGIDAALCEIGETGYSPDRIGAHGQTAWHMIPPDEQVNATLQISEAAIITWHARGGNHPGLTGTHHPAILGQITPRTNYVDLIHTTWCAV